MISRTLLNQFKPSTLAAIIDDLYEQPNVDAELVAKVVDALEAAVGAEESIDYLVDAGVNPQLAVALFE